jgi:hypothetical protein
LDRKEELIAKIRERRARLNATMADIDQRIAVIVEMKDKAVRIGRITAIVVAVTTVGLFSMLLLRAVVGPRRRR